MDKTLLAGFSDNDLAKKLCLMLQRAFPDEEVELEGNNVVTVTTLETPKLALTTAAYVKGLQDGMSGKDESFTPVPNDSGDCMTLLGPKINCPKCGSPPAEHEVRNHNLMWHDGDVYCTRCGAYVRMYDAG